MDTAVDITVAINVECVIRFISQFPNQVEIEGAS